MIKPKKRATLGELFLEEKRVTNPVTRWSYRQIIANRLDRIEKQAEIKAISE